MTATIDHHPTRLARRTGLAYAGIIVCGIVAEFLVRGSLVVADDAAATAANIADAPGLFAAGIGADVAMILLDVAVAFGLYRLLRSVDRRLALTATALRLVQAAVLAVNLVNLTRALDLAQQGDGGSARAALDAVERHALGYDAGLVAFGLSCVVLGRLLARSGSVSRLLATGMTVTGLVYLLGSFAAWFAPGLSAAVDPLYLVAFVVEVAFAARLVTRGLEPARTGESAPVPLPA